jgi:hypothetical protein
MKKIYKEILLLVKSLVDLSEVCSDYRDKIDESSANELMEIAELCENNFLKVKEEIVKMVKEVEEYEKNSKIEVVEKDNGFLIEKE